MNKSRVRIKTRQEMRGEKRCRVGFDRKIERNNTDAPGGLNILPCMEESRLVNFLLRNKLFQRYGFINILLLVPSTGGGVSGLPRTFYLAHSISLRGRTCAKHWVGILSLQLFIGSRLRWGCHHPSVQKSPCVMSDHSSYIWYVMELRLEPSLGLMAA